MYGLQGFSFTERVDFRCKFVCGDFLFLVYRDKALYTTVMAMATAECCTRDDETGGARLIFLIITSTQCATTPAVYGSLNHNM